MSLFLVFLAIAVAGLVIALCTGRGPGAGRVLPGNQPAPDQQPVPDGQPVSGNRLLPGSQRETGAIVLDGLAEPLANLPPVLLPAHPCPADVDRLRFSLGWRGYRMDQVDQVLDRLRDELAAKDELIHRLQTGQQG